MHGRERTRRPGGNSFRAVVGHTPLHEIFGVDVPVGVIVSPASDLRAPADHRSSAHRRQGDPSRLRYTTAPLRDGVHASDRQLDKSSSTLFHPGRAAPRNSSLAPSGPRAPYC